MLWLGFAAIAWVLVHIGLSGTAARDRIVAVTGLNAFMLVFSLASVASLVGLIKAYKLAPLDPLWTTPHWLGWLLVLAMLAACVLFVGSVSGPNPTSAGPATLTPPRGITLVTRHPMLCAFTIWAAVHIIANGDLASLVFFGAFLVTTLAGMPSIDAKLARRDPVRWAVIARSTSIVPGIALLSGRARLSWRELGWIAPVGGLALWVLLLGAHPHVIGVSPLPGG